MSHTNFVLMIMYDMPSLSKEQQKAYRQVNRYLQTAGFYLLQGSIYLKPLSEKQKADRYIQELKQRATEGSHVRALVLTHRHFMAMKTVWGEDTWGEKLIKKPDGVIRI